MLWRIWVVSKEVRYRDTTSCGVCDCRTAWKETSPHFQILSASLKSWCSVSRVYQSSGRDQNTVTQDLGLQGFGAHIANKLCQSTPAKRKLFYRWSDFSAASGSELAVSGFLSAGYFELFCSIFFSAMTLDTFKLLNDFQHLYLVFLFTGTVLYRRNLLYFMCQQGSQKCMTYLISVVVEILLLLIDKILLLHSGKFRYN